ncbi:sensor histidine kinase [Nocardioides sp. T2.26MG-1]|uniref:sensor histidine kinase n=1 Tax=Nocardioides sp. T2.26MG-1 TaxID=3041166 RepID=UPI0024775D99|nr:ATP-binding protein [Nocardioides sp. T2.26MG-1]CAI9404129.1 Adaptive-response sensory-kinase SasA [Nocardioides sp. T2.26MG-1]
MTSLRDRASRLPLRIRLVAGFSAAMFVVLLAAGTFVYWRVGYALDRGLDTELVQATGALAPLVGAGGRVTDRSAADATGVAWQVLDPAGSVLDHGGASGTVGLVSERQLDRVGTTPRTFNVGDFLPISHDPYRLRVAPLDDGSGRFLLAAVRRDHRDEALRELLVQLVVAGLGALALTAWVGERLARAALRPVERYRRRAAAIAAGASDLRLDVSPSRDDEVTRLGHTLNDMLSSLERALDRERQFVNEASHELRTPITLLTSRVQLARRRPRTQAEHERVLEELQVDLDRLARLAEQLLELGSVAGRTGHESCDLAAVTARVVNQRRLAAPADAGDTSTEVPGEPVPVAVADFEVERMLTNLLDNAALHGAAPYAVTVDRPDPGWARLVVADAGPGLPPEILDTATRRFVRSEEARSRPGSGLGLALVQAMVAQAGGELRLCHAGHHASHGGRAPVACTHGHEMTVSILLPTGAPAAAE